MTTNFSYDTGVWWTSWQNCCVAVYSCLRSFTVHTWTCDENADSEEIVFVLVTSAGLTFEQFTLSSLIYIC